MTKVISIYDCPTYDLGDITITDFIEEDSLIYYKTNKVYKFDKVYGNITIRSRVIRQGTVESKYVIDVISAMIDAGYTGPLTGKILLTKEGFDLCKNAKNLADISQYFEGVQQIYLFQSLGGNYYNGTSNRPDLIPDIIFTL